MNDDKIFKRFEVQIINKILRQSILFCYTSIFVEIKQNNGLSFIYYQSCYANSITKKKKINGENRSQYFKIKICMSLIVALDVV